VADPFEHAVFQLLLPAFVSASHGVVLPAVVVETFAQMLLNPVRADPRLIPDVAGAVMCLVAVVGGHDGCLVWKTTACVEQSLLVQCPQWEHLCEKLKIKYINKFLTTMLLWWTFIFCLRHITFHFHGRLFLMIYRFE
jgi:hypothetical protein